MLSCIILSPSNPTDTIRTVKSYLPYLDEVIIGDLFYYGFEREQLELAFMNESKVRLRKMPFNEVFNKGFANVFNQCAAIAKNDIVFITGVGNDLVKWNNYAIEPKYNNWAYLIEHTGFIGQTMYNRKELKLQWCIHEEVKGVRRFDDRPQYVVNDIPKEFNPLYDKVREAVYYEQYRKVLDGEDKVNEDWERWCFRHEAEIRSKCSGNVYDALKTGDKSLLYA